MKKRDSVLDMARSIGIVLVVVGHNYLIIGKYPELNHSIQSFRMPLFLMLSGVFFSMNNSLLKTISLKSDSLIKPYLTASVIAAVVASTSMTSVDGATTTLINALTGALIALPGTIEWTPLWFLPYLFGIHVVATLICGRIHNRKGIALVATTSALFGGHLFKQNGLPWCLDLLIVGMGYYLLGFIGYPIVNNFLSTQRRAAIASLVFFLLWLGILLTLNPTVDLHLRLYSGPEAFVGALAGSLFVLSFCAAMRTAPAVHAIAGKIGPYSLFILIFHGWIQGKISGSLANRTDETWLAALIGILGGVAIPIFLGRIIKRTPAIRALFLPERKSSS